MCAYSILIVKFLKNLKLVIFLKIIASNKGWHFHQILKIWDF